MPAYSLDSDAVEVITGCRAAVVENGGADSCHWADKGFAACRGRGLTFREACDDPALAMMIVQVLILPYLEALFDRSALNYIARRCAGHPRAAAYLLELRGEGLPDDVRKAAEKVASARYLLSLRSSSRSSEYRRDFR